MKPETAPKTCRWGAPADIAVGVVIAIISSAALYGITLYLGKA